MCCQPLFLPDAQRIYGAIAESSRSCCSNCPLISSSTRLSSDCSLYPTSGGPPALSVKPDNLALQGVNEKVKGLGQRAHLTQLLLWVAPVWSAQLLQRLALADFHRTDRQWLNLQRKQGELVKSCSDLLNSTTNQCCTLGGSDFVVMFMHERHKIQS